MRVELISNGGAGLAASILAAGFALGFVMGESIALIKQQASAINLPALKTYEVIDESQSHSPLYSPVESMYVDRPRSSLHWVF